MSEGEQHPLTNEQIEAFISTVRGMTPGPYAAKPCHGQDPNDKNTGWHVYSGRDGAPALDGEHIASWMSGSNARGLVAARRQGEEIASELLKLRKAIAHHHDQKGDDRCWLDDDELYRAAGIEPATPWVGDKKAMLKNCERFLELRCAEGRWPSYADLEKKIAEQDRMIGVQDRLLEEYRRKRNHQRIMELKSELAVLESAETVEQEAE